MKPPPRTRSRPKPVLKPDPGPQRSGKVTWKQAELRKLLHALKRLSRTAGVEQDIDLTFLRKSVPTRSTSEIHSMVESLKDQVISFATLQLKKMRCEEKKNRKPIEMWTDMASAVTGNLEEHVTSAFSQMLMVSSTEPCTLRNCDPPQVHRPPSDKDRLPGRTIPLRPVPHLPVNSERSGTNTGPRLPPFKTPAPTMGPAKKLPTPSQIVRVSNGATSTPEPKQPSEQQPSSISTAFSSESTLSSPHTPLCSSVNSPSPVPSTAPSSTASSCSSTRPKPSTPPVEVNGRFGQTSKSDTKDDLGTFGVKSIVDFEKIYCYLSMIHKPNDDCRLTSMESAIILDLLMSLPEEIPLLDCSKLHKHFVQVYQCLSSPADSSMAREMLKNLNQSVCTPTQGGGSGAPAGPAHGGEKDLQPGEGESQSSESSNTPSQSEEADATGLCPPLNPFMVPVKLLMRK